MLDTSDFPVSFYMKETLLHLKESSNLYYTNTNFDSTDNNFMCGFLKSNPDMAVNRFCLAECQMINVDFDLFTTSLNISEVENIAFRQVDFFKVDPVEFYNKLVGRTKKLKIITFHQCKNIEDDHNHFLSSLINKMTSEKEKFIQFFHFVVFEVNLTKELGNAIFDMFREIESLNFHFYNILEDKDNMSDRLEYFRRIKWPTDGNIDLKKSQYVTDETFPYVYHLLLHPLKKIDYLDINEIDLSDVSLPLIIDLIRKSDIVGIHYNKNPRLSTHILDAETTLKNIRKFRILDLSFSKVPNYMEYFNILVKRGVKHMVLNAVTLMECTNISANDICVQLLKHSIWSKEFEMSFLQADQTYENVGEYLRQSQHLEKFILISAPADDRLIDLLTCLIGHPTLKSIKFPQRGESLEKLHPVLIEILETTQVQELDIPDGYSDDTANAELKKKALTDLNDRAIPVFSSTKSASKRTAMEF